MKALYPIVGLNFVKSEKFVQTLSEGEPLVIKREPTNHVDPKAVAVFWRDQKLGYIPQKNNRDISLALDSDKEFAAECLDGKRGRLHFSSNNRYPHIEIDE